MPIYGLKQSARAWNKCLTEKLTKIGFVQARADSCCFSKQMYGKEMFVLVFVDDILFLYTLNEQLKWFEDTIEKIFKVKQLGEVKNYLGVQISKNERGMFMLSQQDKIEKLLVKFGLQDAHKSETPMYSGYAKESAECTEPYENVTRYQSLIGSLLYLATWTRMDIAYAVSLLAQKCNAPNVRDWSAAKRVLRYLKGTAHHVLVLDVTKQLRLHAFSDASWGDRPEAKSTTGVAIFLDNALIQHKSVKQTLVATSSCEAEVAALNSCLLELEWVYQMLCDINVECKLPINICCDNKAAIHLASGEAGGSKSKHILLRYYSVKSAVSDGKIKLEKCASQHNLADILTKNLGAELFNNLKKHMVKDTKPT